MATPAKPRRPAMEALVPAAPAVTGAGLVPVGLAPLPQVELAPWWAGISQRYGSHTFTECIESLERNLPVTLAGGRVTTTVWVALYHSLLVWTAGLTVVQSATTTGAVAVATLVTVWTAWAEATPTRARIWKNCILKLWGGGGFFCF